MPIPTSRTKEVARITINAEKCNGCGLCIDVCKDFGIQMKDGKAVVSGQPIFGCIGCGHCMAICPKGAIKIEGRFTSPDNLFPLSGKAEMASYDAPLALYFYGSPYTDPADPLIAATYAMTAAESLGLGTCMLGGIHPFIQSGRAARKFREKYGIRFKSREGLFLIIGHPRVKYQHGIMRTFANIDYMKGASKN